MASKVLWPALALCVLSACPPMTSTTDPWGGASTTAGSAQAGAPASAAADPWASPSAASGSPQTGAPAPQATAGVAGIWLDRWSTSMQYKLGARVYDFDTGVWFGGAHEPWDMAPYRGWGIAFEPDGSFLWIRVHDAGIGGCKSYAVHVMKGTASVGPSTIRFHPTAQRQKYASVCNPKLDYDRDVPNQDFELAYTLGATVDTGAPTLQLVDGASGTVYDYFRN